jgi:hypothetical protein
MERWITAVILSGAAMAPIAGAQSLLPPSSTTAKAAKNEPGALDIPPIPRGKSTIFGGEIRELDPVRDQMSLKVFGDRSLKILFDERTQVFRDGKRISVRDLQPEQQASVQTTLDGSKLFALSIHMLTHGQQGEYEGRVVSFDSGTGEMTVSSGLSRQAVKLRVDGSTSFVRKGPNSFASEHAGASDLREGTLVSVNFSSATKGLPVATQVAVLATPGSSFVFEGNLASLNLHDGFLVVVDPRDEKSYQVFVTNLSASISQSLRVGQQVRVVARYDGARYVAAEVTTM